MSVSTELEPIRRDWYRLYVRVEPTFPRTNPPRAGWAGFTVYANEFPLEDRGRQSELSLWMLYYDFPSGFPLQGYNSRIDTLKDAYWTMTFPELLTDSSFECTIVFNLPAVEEAVGFKLEKLVVADRIYAVEAGLIMTFNPIGLSVPRIEEEAPPPINREAVVGLLMLVAPVIELGYIGLKKLRKKRA